MRRTPILALLLLALLAGCATVPLRSLAALSRVDFQTTDLRQLRVAVGMPEAIRTRKDGVRMDAILKIDGEPDRTSVFHLVETEEPDAPEDRGRQGRTTKQFRLGEGDLLRLEGMRKAIEASRSTGRKGSLGLGIAAREFCRLNALGSGPLAVTTYLKTSETGRYVVLTEGFDLRSDPRIAAALDGLPPC